MAVVPDRDAERSANAAPTDLLPFRCDVSLGDHATVSVRGDLDLATAPILLRELLAVLAQPVTAVSVDLGNVTFLDSSGIAALITARQAVADRGVAFALDAIPINVRRVLAVAGVLSVLDIADDGEHVVDHFD